MSELLKSIDARTKLAGTNKLEILLFTLGTNARTGRRETFGINVFKVREVMRTPPITGAPEMPPSVEGMVSLRARWFRSSTSPATRASTPTRRATS